MEFVHFSCVLAVFSILGISMCLSCDPMRIQGCVTQLQTMDMMNTDMEASCREARKASDCFRREVDSCPESMKSVLDMAQQALDTAIEECGGPETEEVEPLASDANDCQSEWVRCQQITRSPVQTVPDGCRKVGEALSCIHDIFHGRCNKFIIVNAKPVKEMMRQRANQCKTHGYSITAPSPTPNFLTTLTTSQSTTRTTTAMPTQLPVTTTQKATTNELESRQDVKTEFYQSQIQLNKVQMEVELRKRIELDLEFLKKKIDMGLVNYQDRRRLAEEIMSELE